MRGYRWLIGPPHPGVFLLGGLYATSVTPGRINGRTDGSKCRTILEFSVAPYLFFFWGIPPGIRDSGKAPKESDRDEGIFENQE